MHDELQEKLAELKEVTEKEVTNPRTRAMLLRYLEDFSDKYSGAAARNELVQRQGGAA